jgi:transposase InsO family protein
VLCKLLGLSKQAYYKRSHNSEKEELKTQIVLEMIKKVRHKMPRLGVKKVLHKIRPSLIASNLEIGRDAFFDFMRMHGLLIKSRRRHCKTTFSAHWLHKYENLLHDHQINDINQLWVSDITYIETGEGFLYLYLITDAYSKKIIGYNLSNDLKASSAVVALKMAIQNIDNCENLIHHSDRGIQYCATEYIAVLKENKILISMSEPNSPTQNAIAERVNGILKTEWIYYTTYATHMQAQKEIDIIINLYNHERPHSSCSMLTPALAHESKQPLKKMWKSYYRKNKSTMGTSEAWADVEVPGINEKRVAGRPGNLHATSVTALDYSFLKQVPTSKRFASPRHNK